MGSRLAVSPLYSIHMNVFLFGASITYGAWDHEGGWANRLRKFVDQKILSSEDEDYDHFVYNLGIPGDRSNYLLERFNHEVLMRSRSEKECAVVISIGTNDSQYSNVDKTFSVPPELFEKNLNELVALARKVTSRIIFVGLLPCDDAKMDPIPWLPEKSYKTEYLRRYNQIAVKVCSEQLIGFVDLFDDFSNRDYRSLLEEGIHPNDEGHRIIFEKVKEALVKLGWI